MFWGGRASKPNGEVEGQKMGRDNWQLIESDELNNSCADRDWPSGWERRVKNVHETRRVVRSGNDEYHYSGAADKRILVEAK